MGPKGSMFEGKTLDDAVRKGLDTLGMSRAEVMINVVEEGSGGFLGLGARPYKVIIMPRPGGPPRDEEGERDRERRGRGRREGGRDGRRGRGEGRGERNGRGRRSAEGAREGRERSGEGRSGESRGGEGRGGEGRRGERRGGERGRGGRRREERPAERSAERTETRPPSPAPAEVAGDDANGGDEQRRRRRRGRRGGRGRRGERRGEGENQPRENAPAEAHAPEGPAAAPAPHEPPVGFVAVADAASTDVVAKVSRPETEDVQTEAVIRFEERSEPADPASAQAEPAAAHAEPAAAPAATPAPATPAVAESRPSEPAAEDHPALADDAMHWTTELMKAMGFDAKVSAKADGDRVDVTVEVAQQDDLLTGPKGEVRQAMQHLLNRMVNRGQGSRYHLQLEVNDFWQQREDELRTMAADLAGEAIEKNDEVVTEYLNSQERRIVHMTLRDDERVKTYALGTGMIKRVAIAPADFPEGDRTDD